MQLYPQFALFGAIGIVLGSCGLSSAADPTTSSEAMQQLIDQLGSRKFSEREQAFRELSRLREAALPILKHAAHSPNAEVRRRAQLLVERLEPPAPVVDAIPRIKIFR